MWPWPVEVSFTSRCPRWRTAAGVGVPAVVAAVLLLTAIGALGLVSPAWLVLVHNADLLPTAPGCGCPPICSGFWPAWR